ncbi:MAG: hypothetical protein WAV15_03095 [Minisyncoccia bacterium]
MMDIVLKLLFFLFILPYLIIEEGIEMLNGYRVKHGKPKIKMDWMTFTLVALVIVVIILWLNGFR